MSSPLACLNAAVCASTHPGISVVSSVALPSFFAAACTAAHASWVAVAAAVVAAGGVGLAVPAFPPHAAATTTITTLSANGRTRLGLMLNRFTWALPHLLVPIWI